MFYFSNFRIFQYIVGLATIGLLMSCEQKVNNPIFDKSFIQAGKLAQIPASDMAGNVIDLVASSKGRSVASVPYVSGFSFPFGNDQIYSTKYDGDGWYVAQGLVKDFNATLYHLGEDWNGEGFNEQGYPCYSMAEGEVVYSANAGSCWGEVVIVRHLMTNGSQIETLYGHLSKRNVSVGQIVQRRQQIGNIGGSGLVCSGVNMTPHAHVEARYSSCSSWGKPGPGYASSTSGWFNASSLIYANFPTVPVAMTTPSDGSSINKGVPKLFSWQNYWLINAESRIQIAYLANSSPSWNAQSGFQTGIIYNQNIGKYNGLNLTFSSPGTYYWSVRSSNVGNSSGYGLYTSNFSQPRKLTVLNY